MLQFSNQVAAKCSVHPGQDLLYQCLDKNCDKPVCGICVYDQHFSHSTPEIDEYIEVKRQNVQVQNERMKHYCDKIKILLGHVDQIVTEMGEIPTGGLTVPNDKMKPKITNLGKSIQNHKSEIESTVNLAENVRGELDTFQVLSLIKQYFQNCLKLYKADFNIYSVVRSFREDVPTNEELRTQLRTIADLKNEAFYPHLDTEWETEINYFKTNNSIFLCNEIDGSLIVAGDTDDEIVRYTRLGEVTGKWSPPENWTLIDDMIEMNEQGERALLCCSNQDQEIVKLSLDDNSVESKFKHRIFQPRKLAAMPNSHWLYVFEKSIGNPQIVVLNTESVPYQVTRSLPLSKDFSLPVQMICLSDTDLILFAACTTKSSFLAAIREKSGKIAWRVPGEFRGCGLSVAPNGIILASIVSNVLCFNKEGQMIHKYEFEKSAVLPGVAWYQGFSNGISCG